MLSLANRSLSVALLDPEDPADQRRQGTRYCWGGYIWQVTDPAAGPLLAGPEWPDPNPTAFNGQGLPESFRSHEFGTQRPLMLEHGRGFIVGIGDVAPDEENELAVVKPCSWTVTPNDNSIEFCAAQSRNGYGSQLTRRVALTGRTVASTTSITNTGTRPLPLHWFAHPFFMLNDRMLTCSIPPTWDMAENIGYTLESDHRITFKRRFENLHDGHFQQLVIGKTPLRAKLSHPRIDGIVFTTDFVPDTCPIWGNSNTWSIEPYIATDLAPGARRTWELRYEFGKVR
jgi:hypothetical protein